MTVGLAVSDPYRPSLVVTLTVAVRMTGPPGPSAMRVQVVWPGLSPPTFTLPLVAVSIGAPVMPKPETRTPVAWDVVHVTVAMPPHAKLPGETAMEPATFAPPLTVTVAVRVTGPPVPRAVRVYV